ncbi:hypothetical protein SOCE26_030740 [Sorangium cellulosum]|uniref:Uncharacterized protein n=1 Tax=Sorangium cellulosum TaxID=56 RepID=A0A2L0EQX1_SORCE|nr:hypothetical protein [Sorangium cellulosum]AUX41652.1 hypothetical protein SOCE26_030740 [Sorangium cellulosum]
MSERRWLSWVIAAAMCAALSGCGEGASAGGQIGGVTENAGDGCDHEKEDIGLDEASPLGFSANDALATVAGERSAELVWAKGGTTTATFSVGAPTAARFVRSTEGTGSGLGLAELAPAEGCADHLEIDVPLGFLTGDGAFAELLPATLRASQAGAATFHHDLDLDALEGTYEVTEVDPSEFRKVYVYLSGTLSADAVIGGVSGIAESHPSGSGPEASVSALPFNIAEF